MSVVTIERKVLEKNDAFAAENRRRLAEARLFAINVVSSPGAGKTSLLEHTIQRLDGRLRISVVEGDVQTDLDAQRVARYGAPVVQIVTNGGCHLEAKLVQDALARLDLAATDLLVIENVGNLVCPANYDLGEAMKVVLLSTTEGDDKPLKYPAMFRNASVLVVNKIDLLPYVPCDVDTLVGNARTINPALRVFQVSCTTGAGLDDWCTWLAAQVTALRA
ncbi:MAG: hydrogenase accessory protein HypB [Acidobacteria bacterium]|nr:MAG: hydrogenase accessory protein HypB [Acidobacteriota bacterium]